jgi:hypothetical protein
MSDDTDNQNDETPDPVDVPIMTIESLRDWALRMFDGYLAHASDTPGPDSVNATPEEKQDFLTLEETENILREYAKIGPGVYAVGGETMEEAKETVKAVMAALMQRILSNVLSAGANVGLFDVVFDDETNNFAFGVSEKGQRLYEKIKDKIEAGEEIDLDLDFGEDEDN